MTDQLDRVADYYDQTQRLYKVFWHRGKSYGIHYGYWDKSTKNHQEALLNQNKFMASKLKIKPGEKVLDAGCGIGGSSIWLAQHYNIQSTGITVSFHQISKAQELAEKYGLQDRLHFEKQDYLHTRFPDKSFDIVWGLESVCYAKSKKEFLKEAYRQLKPGGQIIVADGFLKRDLRDAKEEAAYKDFNDGFVLPNLARMDDFEKWMKEVGFKNVKFWDTSKEAVPSSKIMYRRVALLYPLAWLMHKLGIVSDVLFLNSRAGLAQRKLVKSGAAGYAAFYGQK